ncbi:MAG: LTA synthase family protein [Pseudomonadales bacterium]|nr:LTA synthase family protein [Pseudomonadales bacterium]
MTAPGPTSRRQRLRLPAALGADLGFLAGALAVLLFVQSLVRLLLLWRNWDLGAGVPLVSLFHALATGVRFDLVIAGHLLLVPALALLAPRGLRPRILWVGLLTLATALILFAGVVEPDFYHEFHTRLNSLAIEYLRADPATVSSMLWNGFPVLRYLALWLALTLASGWCYRALARRIRPNGVAASWPWRVAVCALVLVLLGGAARGTLRFGPPLRWGDAFHSDFPFANHLGLNGVFTLAKAVAAADPDRGAAWLRAMPAAEALAQTRALLLTSDDRLVAPQHAPLLREHRATDSGADNIVFIILESFAGEFVGALGHPGGVTPEFDRLADEGLLFERFFANGTHTHQGMFASVACFPNLPGFEYLMQLPEGMQGFSGLGNLLAPRGFSDLYVYNGSFTWDNQNGFFGNQGFRHFVGRDDYVDPRLDDPTWGVSDEDMFARAAAELSALPADRPFFAVLQTLSNHTPYHLPEPLPFAPVRSGGAIDQRLTAMKYSDWALGQFFARVRGEPWFARTLFVLVGDHGFGIPDQATDIDLARFHVPALLLGPGIRARFGARRATVASQVDLVPTAVGQLGGSFVHQCWGRDLLALPADDPGFAVIKPSGSDATTAILAGDEILVRSPAGVMRLYQYRLAPALAAVPVERAAEDARLARALTGYVGTALRALKGNAVAAALPAAPVTRHVGSAGRASADGEPRS